MTREHSLFGRLVLRITIVLIIGAGLLITSAWYYGRSAASQTYDRLLLGAALQMADSLSVEDGQLVASLPVSAFELLGFSKEDRIFYRLIDTEGQTLTGYRDLAGFIDYTAARTGPVFLNDVYRDVPVRLVVVSRVLSEPPLSGWAYVMVAQTTEARSVLTQEITSRAILLVILMSSLALIAGILAIRYSLQPVAALGSVLNKRDPQDLTPLDLDIPSEMKPFIGSINHFMGRLDQRVILLQRFIGDAAHQIRTPLTALAAQADMLDTETLPENAQHSLQRMRSRISELSRLTGQLLNHAMVIHRAGTVHLEKTDLVLIARQAFRMAVPITVNPDIVVSFEASEMQVLVAGDVVSLREAIANIIDNALRHGSQYKLAVKVSIENCRALVEICDDGAGIPREKWQHVLERFITSKTHEGNSGLGFSIASEVATAHSGLIRFKERTTESCFCVILDLPLWQDMP
ncbi:sensor histidine kinase [Pseudochrobactrum asaccharolyticum]|uniref:sensor histidine kinase n=1 Tax=Pseudochrobactrum asaccharolyticum TaxID=354351 RepID=UPI0040433070